MDLLVTEFASVGEFRKGFEEARAAAIKSHTEFTHTFDLHCEQMLRESKEKELEKTQETLSTVQRQLSSQAASLTEQTDELKALKARLNTLTEENSSLLKHSLEQSEAISNYKLEASRVADSHLTTDMLIYQLSTYTPELDFEDDNMFFDILGPSPTADVQKINRHATRHTPIKNPYKTRTPRQEPFHPSRSVPTDPLP